MNTLLVLLTFVATLAATPVLEILTLATSPHPTTSAPVEMAVFERHHVTAHLEYAWDFGDDTTSTTETASTTHRYTAADTYILSVTVTDTVHALTAKTKRLVTVP